MKPLNFIAELSGNHEGSLDKAISLVEGAARAGATHVKIQTFRPETLTFKSRTAEYTLSSGHKLWANKSLWDLYSATQFPYEWHEPLFDAARSSGVEPLSTPFDESAVDFLLSLGVRLLKIASLEIVDLPLIRHAASTGLPLILSTGTATLEEVKDAVFAAREAGCADLTLLVCTSEYPAPAKLANLARIGFLEETFGCRVGFSDHSIGTHVSNAAIALGARVIEKHVKLADDSGSLDAGFSASLAEFEKLVSEGKDVYDSVGSGGNWGIEEEGESRRFRPSIIATKNIEIGEEFTLNNVATLRPAIGLPPKYLPAVLGMKAINAISAGEGVTEHNLDGRELIRP